MAIGNHSGSLQELHLKPEVGVTRRARLVLLPGSCQTQGLVGHQGIDLMKNCGSTDRIGVWR